MTLPSWVDPDENKPAPEPLLLVQAFVNTRDIDAGTDLLAEPGPAGHWLRQAGLLRPEGTVTPGDLRVAREFREAIRSLLSRNGGGPAPAPGDLATLGKAARAAGPHLDVGPAGQVRLGPDPGGSLADGLLGLLLLIRDAQRDGTWDRLKACGNRECRWAFYDRSHGRRGAWCDMAACGNVMKNRSLRARRAGRAGAPGPG